MHEQQLAIIRKCCAHSNFRYTQHFMQRIIQRNITLADVATVLDHGEIIEDYPNDYPLPSCLVLGYTINNRPLHIVCGIGSDELFLITAYQPNPTLWTNNFKTRQKLEGTD